MSAHPSILLVDDDRAILEMLSLFLKSKGNDIFCAKAAHEAFAFALRTTTPIDLLISDVLLPDMGGSEMATTIMKLHRGARVIFISGHDSQELKARDLIPDNALVLRKPFSLDEFSNCVTGLLPARNGHSALRNPRA